MMTLYGLKKEHVDLIRSIFERVFGSDQTVQIFLFGSRATGKHKKFSDIDLAVKSKDKLIDRLITKAKNLLEDSNLTYKVDLVN